MTAPTLKAYMISNGDDAAEIVFVRSRRDAVRWERNEYECGENVTREVWADVYSPGPVPPLAKLDAGWWLECWGCGCRIDGDLTQEFQDASGAWQERALEPVEDGHAVYCTAQCRDDHHGRNRQEARWKYIAAAWMTAALLHKYPGIVPMEGAHVYATRDQSGAWGTQQASIPFEFPGCSIGHARFQFDRLAPIPAVWICAGDKDAWGVFVGTPE